MDSGFTIIHLFMSGLTLSTASLVPKYIPIPSPIPRSFTISTPSLCNKNHYCKVPMFLDSGYWMLELDMTGKICLSLQISRNEQKCQALPTTMTFNPLTHL